jgi:hypothetical protein
MALDTISFISGITGLLIVTVGYLLAVYSFSLYLKSKSNQTLALTVTLLGTCSVWLGVAVNFLLYLIQGESSFLGVKEYFILISWPIGILIPVTMYMTTSFIYEQYQKIAVIISAIIGGGWIFLSLILIPLNVISLDSSLFIVEYSAGTLPDSSFKGITLILTLLGLIIIAISGGLFVTTARSSEDRVAKLRGFYLGFGYLLFSFSSLGDAISESLANEYILIVIRFLVVLSFVLVSIAVIKPNRIFRSI